MIPALLLLSAPSLSIVEQGSINGREEFVQGFAVSPTFEFALSNWQATPKMQMEDAYKWLFHACQGAEHAVPDPDTPRQWLSDEWKTLGPVPFREPLWIPLRTDGQLGRINLRPYKTKNGQSEPLLAAFIRSANSYKADRTAFKKVWHELGSYLTNSSIRNLNLKAWNRVNDAYQTRGYPAIDHSAAYENLYHPAYRVLTLVAYRSLIRNH